MVITIWIIFVANFQKINNMNRNHPPMPWKEFFIRFFLLRELKEPVIIVSFTIGLVLMLMILIYFGMEYYLLNTY